LPGCDQIYGTASGYELCLQRQDECEFLAFTDGSCSELCGPLGGTCVTAYDDLNLSCAIDSTLGCNANRAVQICVCSRQPSCDQGYGLLPGYTLCRQSPTECEFMTTGASATCRELCTAAGSNCLAAYDDVAMDCVRAGDIGCDSSAHQTFICVCARP
jgi:hypothetical protein